MGNEVGVGRMSDALRSVAIVRRDIAMSALLAV